MAPRQDADVRNRSEGWFEDVVCYPPLVKHAVLTSIAHNVADSLASGCGLMIGVSDMDVFGAAARGGEGYLEVDFLAGTITGGQPSPSLTKAVHLYAEALPGLCERQGAEVADFRRLVVRYSGVFPAQDFVVEVTDRGGKTSRYRYVGRPGARPKAVDSLGRARRVRSA